MITENKFNRYVLLNCNKCKCISVINTSEYYNRARNNRVICPTCKCEQIVYRNEEHNMNVVTEERYKRELERLKELNTLKNDLKKNEKDIYAKDPDDEWVIRNLKEKKNCYVNRPVDAAYLRHLMKKCRFIIRVRPTRYVDSGYILERIR